MNLLSIPRILIGSTSKTKQNINEVKKSFEFGGGTSTSGFGTGGGLSSSFSGFGGTC